MELYAILYSFFILFFVCLCEDPKVAWRDFLKRECSCSISKKIIDENLLFVKGV